MLRKISVGIYVQRQDFHPKNWVKIDVWMTCYVCDPKPEDLKAASSG